eukprot:354992-Chlamydomonas_euryale.AAC.2
MWGKCEKAGQRRGDEGGAGEAKCVEACRSDVCELAACCPMPSKCGSLLLTAPCLQSGGACRSKDRTWAASKPSSYTRRSLPVCKKEGGSLSVFKKEGGSLPVFKKGRGQHVGLHKGRGQLAGLQKGRRQLAGLQKGRGQLVGLQKGRGQLVGLQKGRGQLAGLQEREGAACRSA